MLAKVINLTKSAKGKNVGFGPAVQYIFRDDKNPAEHIEGGQINLDCDVDARADREVMTEILNHDSKKVEKNGKFKGNPVYHYTINWQEGEQPTKEQIHKTVEHTLKALGMQECQTVYAIHRDTDNDHVHVLVNRVHPEKGIIVGPPRRDYLILDKAMRELEISQGWKHAPGPNVVVPDRNGNPAIIKMTKAERAAHDIAIPDPTKIRESQQAIRSEKNTGAPSFQKWLANEVSKEIKEAINRPGSTWSDVHVAMAKRGCSLEVKGSGLIVKTVLDGRTLTAKASQMNHDFGKGRLEKQLGTFQPAPYQAAANPEKTYSHFVQVHQSSIEHDHPGITGRDNPERMLRRIERAKDREDLHAKFKHEQRGLKSERPFLKKEMTRKHQQERKDLFDSLKNKKIEFIADMKKQGITGPSAYSLWAREKIILTEALRDQHKQERQGFSVNQPKGQVWRTWLEQEAGQGNEAAKSALRGIKYREVQGKEQNSISGEDLDPLKPSKKTDRVSAEDPHKITLANLTPEVNEFRQAVIYRDGSGNKRITDEGSRVIVHDKSDGTLETALDLASQKYGREVYLTGSAEFREEAARECAHQGIRVADKDLQILWNQERYDRQPAGMER